jgi:hypothetical protein
MRFRYFKGRMEGRVYIIRVGVGVELRDKHMEETVNHINYCFFEGIE